MLIVAPRIKKIDRRTWELLRRRFRTKILGIDPRRGGRPPRDRNAIASFVTSGGDMGFVWVSCLIENLFNIKNEDMRRKEVIE